MCLYSELAGLKQEVVRTSGYPLRIILRHKYKKTHFTWMPLVLVKTTLTAYSKEKSHIFTFVSQEPENVSAGKMTQVLSQCWPVE